MTTLVNETNMKKTSGITYFLKGLLVFLALGFDAIQIMIDDLIYPKLKGIPFFDKPWYALVTHWGFVIVVWTLALIYFYKWIHRQSETTKMNLKMTRQSMWLIPVAIVCSVLLAVIDGMMFGSELPQILREYRLFVRDHGSMGHLVAVFQNVYYVIESGLVVMLLGLMQSAGEVWFKKENIPWGSIGLCLTWGIVHIVHGLPAAIWITFTAGLLGLFYVKSKKNVWASFIFILLMFFI